MGGNGGDQGDGMKGRGGKEGDREGEESGVKRLQGGRKESGG